MKLSILGAAGAALFTAAAASASPVVDGSLTDADGYGAAKSQVTYAPGAPTSNFGTPTPFSDITSYSIYLTSDATAVYGLLQAAGLAAPGATPPSFANLYFDIDPQANNGSDLGFSIGAGGISSFVPGMSGSSNAPGSAFSVSGDGKTIEFSLPNTLFTMPIAGLTYYGDEQFPTAGSNVVLRLSQSFGYSVAGGATYGANRLGAVTLGGDAVAAVPEPASWALMILGFGAIGAMARYRRRKTTVALA